MKFLKIRYFKKTKIFNQLCLLLLIIKISIIAVNASKSILTIDESIIQYKNTQNPVHKELLFVEKTAAKINNKFKFTTTRRRMKAKNNLMQVNGTNQTYNLTKPLNNTFSHNVKSQYDNFFNVKTPEEFKTTHNKPEYNLSNPQLEEIIKVFITKNNEKISQDSLRGFHFIFLSNFAKCDVNNDNKLVYSEFVNCLKTDKYLQNIHEFYYKDGLQFYPNVNVDSQISDSKQDKKKRKSRKINEDKGNLPNKDVDINQDANNNKDSNNTLSVNVEKRKIFEKRLFHLLDYNYNSYLNFYQYMQLRLLAFSWRKCTVMKPYIAENEFICAFDIVNNISKSRLNHLSKRIFSLAIELSNYNYHLIENSGKTDYETKLFNSIVSPFKHPRYIDFLRFTDVALSSYLYSSINQKDDGDLSFREFSQALNSGVLPQRFNLEIVKNFFQLCSAVDKEYHDIDLLTFIFHDYFLKRFLMVDSKYDYIQKFRKNENEEKNLKSGLKFKINKQDLLKIIKQFDFPEIISLQIIHLPYKKLTESDYESIVSLKLEKRYGEANFLLFNSLKEKLISNKLSSQNKNKYKNRNLNTEKALKKDSQNKSSSSSSSKSSSASSSSSSSTKTTTTTIKYLTYNVQNGVDYIWDILDNDNDNLITFSDYITMIQSFYLFNQLTNQKGIKEISIPDVFDFTSTYTGLPRVRKEINFRANHLKELNQVLRINAYYYYVLLRFEDFTMLNTGTQNNLVNEITLRLFLKKIDAEFLPIGEIDTYCLREAINSRTNQPMYDWRCAVLRAIGKNLEIRENLSSKKLVDDNSLNIIHTGFYNFNK